MVFTDPARNSDFFRSLFSRAARAAKSARALAPEGGFSSSLPESQPFSAASSPPEEPEPSPAESFLKHAGGAQEQCPAQPPRVNERWGDLASTKNSLATSAFQGSNSENPMHNERNGLLA